MNTAKEAVKSLLDKLPDECTLEDVQASIVQLQRGEGIPMNQVMRTIRKNYKDEVKK